jgi:hypothetical protein
LISNLQNIKLSKNQNLKEKSFNTNVHESSTEVLLFLKNLETLRIPWSKFPYIAQIEILKYAHECYVSDISMNEMANKGNVRKYVRSYDTKYENKDEKINNDDKNKVINDNEDNKKFNQINEKKIMINSNNKKPLLLSHGLDLLSVISNLGCKWKDITSLSSITANYLIQNSCEIIIKSRTRVSTKSNPTNYEYSVGVIERNNRLLKYGRTFVRTYDYLNTNFEDFDVVSEDVVLKSFSIVLEGSINDVIMKESSHNYGYDYDWGNDNNDNNDVMIKRNIHSNVRNSDNNENNNQQRSLEEGSIDDDDNYNKNYNDDNDDSNDDDDHGNGDVKNSENIPNSGMSNYNIIHAEFELLEKMEMKSNTDLPLNTETVSNPLFSVEKKQADDDFFTEIENISKFSKKVKKTSVTDRSKNSKNIGLNEIKRIPGEMVEKTGLTSTPSSSSPSISSSSSSSSTSTPSLSTPSSSSSSSSTSSSSPSSLNPSISSSPSSSSLSSSSASTTTKVPPPSVPTTASSHSNDDVFDVTTVLSILQSSGLKWHRISPKNKIEFSILISELLLKINDIDYYPPSNISKDSNTSTTQAKADKSNPINNTNLKERIQKQNEEIQSYMNKNKKFFYFLNIRILFLSFLIYCGIDKLTVSPQLRNNILLIEDDVRTSLDDILSLRSSHPMISSLGQFLEKYSK